MLGNLVNRHDFVRLAEKIAADGIEPLVARFVRRRGARVQAAWADGADATSQWWMIAAVRRRWATMVCGQPDLDFPEWMRRRHLAGRDDLVGLSVGCGTGYRVARWAALGIFRRIDAFDLSPGRVAAAGAEVERQGVGDRVALRVADMATVALPDAGYDVVIGEQALHHFTGLDATFARLARSLRPDGILYVDEFVGPTRHQWTARQLAAANDLLRQLPEEYRRMLDGRVKRIVMRPSILRMLITDPSEAVESGRLQAVLREHFDVIEQHGYGGAVLEPLLCGIAHNFCGDDPETRGLLERCFAAEDELLAAGTVQHDFVVAVARP